MSDRKTVLRYLHILNRLRQSPASFIEIDDYLAQQSSLQGENFNVSKRQFSRILNDIKSVFELDIEYDAKSDEYFIDKDSESEITRRRLEALDTLCALKLGNGTSAVVHFEQRQPLGTEHMLPLVDAIKKQIKIQFEYQKFWEASISARMVEPLGIKEFRNRWYLVAKDLKDGKLKTFGLDRMSELVLTDSVFESVQGFSIERYFEDFFGIITDDSIEAVDIVLSFDPVQGKYIKSLPLHKSQTILSETESEVQIKVKLRPTWDFYQEILFLGELVRVISPPAVVQEVIKLHQNAITKHNHEGSI